MSGGLNLYGMITGIGDAFTKSYDTAKKGALASDLGEKVKAGDYSGAADAALKAGDLQTGLALVKLGESRGASKELATTLGGMFGGGADANPATGGTIGTMGQNYRDAGPKMPAFASTGGGMGDYLNTVRGVESSGNDAAKNPNSTATGRYQFTQETWGGLARRRPDLGLTPNGRTDPAQQERAMQAFTAENADALSRAGIPITSGNLYVSHFLGQAGGPRFIAGAMSNPDAPATQFVSPGAAAANQRIFFNRDGSPKTAGQVYAERTGHFPGGAASTPAQPTQVATADTDVANKPTPDAQPAAFVIPGQDAPDAKPSPAGVGSMPVSVQLAGAGIPRQVAGAVGRAAPGSPERIGALIRASLIPGLSEQQQGVVKTLLASEMEAGKLTSDQREYAMAQAQGFPGTFVDYKNTLSGRQAEGAKIAEQVSAREQEVRSRGLDPNEPSLRRYILTGQLAEEKADKDAGNTITAQVEARKKLAPSLGLVEGTPAWQAYTGTGKIGRDQELSATDKQAIQQSDDTVLSGRSAIDALKQALDLSKKAYDGPTASYRGAVTSIWGNEGGVATKDLNNVVMTNALGQLKAIFGGNPTEGERAVLLQIQGSADQPQTVRENIFKRGIALAEKRVAFEEKRGADLRGGTYYKAGNSPSGDRQPPSLSVKVTPSMKPEDVMKRYPPGTRLILPDGSEGVVPERASE